MCFHGNMFLATHVYRLGSNLHFPYCLQSLGISDVIWLDTLLVVDQNSEAFLMCQFFVKIY